MFHFTNKPEKRKNTFNSKFLKFIQISAFQESTQPLQSITFTKCFQLNIFAYTGEKKKWSIPSFRSHLRREFCFKSCLEFVLCL